MKYICPLITVADIQRSRDFYEGVLGQKVKYDLGENVTFEGDFAIHLQSHFSRLIDNKPIRQGGNNFELYFEFDDIDHLADRLKEQKVEFVHEAREQPWRQKVVRVYDPDRHIIDIGESLEYLSYRLSNEGLTAEQVSVAVGIPVDFVRASIDRFSK
ncbi:MAG TPA: VOC family protein [Bacteroidales bacterium]|nr:VOC family protein [Bacteroidales bacterium]HPT03139.1 VOC family protein [Bacteroidales bacterium]